MDFDFLTSLLFPRMCVACRARLRGGALCEKCRAAVPLARTFFCGRCGAALARTAAAPAEPLFRECHPSFPYVLGTAAGYEAPSVRTLVRALKFRGVRAAAEPLASLLIEYAAPFAEIFCGRAVVPIPLARARLRTRGFNQAELIARRFAQHFALPLAADLLFRTRDTKPQSETMRLAERKENLHGCFAVATSGARPLAGKSFILIDDVTTSGTTFFEAARAMQQAGAGPVIALAAAQTHRGTIPTWHHLP